MLSIHASTRRESREPVKILAVTLTIVLTLSAIVPKIHPIDPVDEAVRRYLRAGETIREKRELTFGDVTLTVYNLSSGYYIIYSHKHSSVVLGEEWFLNSYSENLALQLVSLVVYDVYKPLKDERRDYYFPHLFTYANKACETALSANVLLKEMVITGLIHLAAGIALLILVPPLGGVQTVLFFISFATALAADLSKFIEYFKINQENSPKLFLALAMMPPYNDTALKEFENILNKITDNNFRENLKNIQEGIHSINLAFDTSSYVFMTAYSIASSNPDLLVFVEQAVGKETLENAGAFFMFNHLPRREAVGRFREFSQLVKHVWARKVQPGMLGDYILANLAGALKNIAVHAVISILRDYFIKLREDLHEFIGFHTSHFYLVRELSLHLNNLLLKLENSIELPTLDNVQKFLYYKYLFHVILSEYYEGASKLSDQTLKKIPPDILRLWGFDADADPEAIRRHLIEKRLEYETTVNKTLADVLIYSTIVSKEFDKYKVDMARRRGGGPPEEAGMRIFLVIDVSGSMFEQFKGARKIDAAKAAAKDFISLLSSNDQAGIVKFSDTAGLVSGLTSNKSALAKAIELLQPGGSTAIGDGIWLALDQLEKASGLRAVILLTDGIHNAGIRTPEEAAERARSLGIPVYTLGFGEKKDIDEERMRKVAEMTGGQYFYAPGPEDLRRLYISLSQRISGYVAEKIIVDSIKAGEAKTFTTLVPAGTPYLGVRLSYGGSLLSLELESPSGYKLSFHESNVLYSEDVGFISVSIHNPETGNWKIHVRGVETPPEGLEYRLVLLKPSVTTSVDRLDLKLKAGESREVVVKLKAMMDLASIELAVVGNLRDIVASIQPQRIPNVKEGQEIPVKIVLNAPHSPTSWTYTGGVQITAAASRVYIPVSVALDALFAIATANATDLKPGRSIRITVHAIDTAGRAVAGAKVTATLAGQTYTFEDRGDGTYEATLTGFSPGVHKLNVTVVKQGYPTATCPFYIFVLLPGDINRDWIVDYRDIAILVSTYGTKIGYSKYHPNADLNEDGEVDYKDLALLITNYGKKV